MMHLSQEDERAADRLTLQLLQDAYLDLAAVLHEVQPQTAGATLAMIEQRFADVLRRICEEQAEGDASRSVAIAVGERLGEVMEQAHGRIRDAVAA